MGESNTKDGLKDAWGAIKNVAHDLLTIDVTTFSAPNVTLDLANGKALKLDELFKEMEARVKERSCLTLTAHTHVDYDLDAVMIVEDDASAGLMDAHNKAVQTAIEARQSFVKALKGMFG